MTFNRNYAAVPQTPTAPGYAPIPINRQAANAAVLPMTFPCPLASEAVITNPAVSTPGSPYPLILTVPSRSLVEGQPFDFLASGVLVQPGATPTVGFTLYSGTSMTIASNTVLKTIAAQAVPGGSAPFFLLGRMIADSISGKLYGTLRALIGASTVAEAAFTNPITGLNFGNDPVASFLLTVTPTVANAGNYVKLYEYALNFG